MDTAEFLRRAKSFSSTSDLRDAVADWGARWAGVMQQAKYGEIGGKPSGHYSQCRDYPELLAEYLDGAFPVHEVLPDDPTIKLLLSYGLVLWCRPGTSTMVLVDLREGVWARRAY